MVTGFDEAFSRLSANVTAFAEAHGAADPSPATRVTTTVTSPDAMVEVVVSDGMVSSLHVDSQWMRETHPSRAWEQVRATLNAALAQNQEAVLKDAAASAPSVSALLKLVETSRADFKQAQDDLHRRIP